MGLMADDVMVELVRDELERISDRGELASRSGLQAAVGIGAGDLERALGVLRDRGEASEVEPDGYRLVRDDDDDLPPAPRENVAPAPEPGVSLAEAERVSAVGAGSSRVESAREATVTMPRAMVDAIDPPAFGLLLKAGIEAAPAGVPFVFEVTP